MIGSHKLDAITVECFSLVQENEVTACLGLSWLNDKTIPAGCEGDLCSILGMMLMKEMNGNMPWMANVASIKGNEVLFAHCMSLALERARVAPDQVGYINLHGTSTPVGDPAETQAIKRAFGEQAYQIPMSSTKSMTGHLLGAAGAVEALASILAIQNQIVPPTINHITPDPEIDEKLDFTFNKAKEREINVAISNTFGFGGHNATVVFKKL